MTKPYRRFESLRVALLVTFISGFINAYTFNTQDRRFAGVQTGNILYMMIHFAKQEWRESFSFLLPIVAFIIGQFFAYHLRLFVKKRGLSYHSLAAKVLMLLLLLTAYLAPLVHRDFTIVGLAFFASIQLDVFRRVRGLAYANMMMTGNVKNLGYFLARGLAEQSKKELSEAFFTFIAILSFMLGTAVSTWLSQTFFELTLYLALIPSLILVILLDLEVRHLKSDKKKS